MPMVVTKDTTEITTEFQFKPNCISLLHHCTGFFNCIISIRLSNLLAKCVASIPLMLQVPAAIR